MNHMLDTRILQAFLIELRQSCLLCMHQHLQKQRSNLLRRKAAGAMQVTAGNRYFFLQASIGIWVLEPVPSIKSQLTSSVEQPAVGKIIYLIHCATSFPNGRCGTVISTVCIEVRSFSASSTPSVCFWCPGLLSRKTAIFREFSVFIQCPKLSIFPCNEYNRTLSATNILEELRK